MVKPFKKSFAGSWHSWTKVPQIVRDQWFNDFEKKYSFLEEDRALVRHTFNRVGRERLSDTLGKAKREFSRTKKIPKWISQIHWNGLMLYWNSDEFKQISEINSMNRKSSNNGEGPSLHTGGSVAFSEYRRRHKELTGEDLRSDELYLNTHRTKNEQWICKKSHRMWNTFTDIIKKNVDGGGNITTDGEEEGEQAENLLETMSGERILDAWVEAVGGPRKGKLYGLGSEYYLPRDPSSSSCASNTSGVPQQTFVTPKLEKLIDHVVEQRMIVIEKNIQARIQEAMGEEVEAAVRVFVGRMFCFNPTRAQE